MTSLKKGYGSPTRRGTSQLRSPVVKRPLAAPVTMQGWLHKQGSEGLMLWKKRWFVLSEYCLFYYKTSEEEKLLGSILLPSYKISPCGVEDKVYRKFSFKAEHANMRTYYFAADTQQLMAQWMNALSLASILQEGTSWGEGKNISSHQLNNSADDSDSGFHGHFRPADSSGDCLTPSNGWRPPSQGYHQPLYANAPPKPRRLNNDTSSPERSPERASDDGRHSKMAQPQEYTLRSDRAYNYAAQHSHRPPLTLPPNSQPQERRTPDTYGRSNSTTPQTGKVISSKPKTLDYEDVYQTNPDLINAMYSHGRMYSNQPVQYRQPRRTEVTTNSVPIDSIKRLPPRPHSADFLEYDAKRAYQSPTPQSSDSGAHTYYQRNAAQPRRPKSSLDIVHNEGVVDGTHWTEESYARKMRQSASYVSPQLHNLSNSSRATTPSVRQIPVVSPMYYNGPVNGELSSSVAMRQHSDAIRAQERRWSEYVDRTNGQFVRSASARLPRHDNEDRTEDDGSDKSYQAAFRRRNSTDSRDNAARSQQREESMKRLLEWKQRMLQSPLTRKSSGSSNRGTAQNQLSQYYHQAQALRDANHHSSRSHSLTNDTQPSPDAWRRDGWDKDALEHARVSRRKHSDAGRSRSQDGRRSVASVSRYNSYSSDDEEAGSTRECRKRLRRSSREAGRSRVNSLEKKSARTTPTNNTGTFPDYENISVPETTKSSNSKVGSEKVYTNLYKNGIEDHKLERNYCSNRSLQRKKSSDDYGPGESFDSGNTLAESSILGYEDRFTISSKHSDSGYDTLQTGGVLPADPEVSDLLKFRFDKRKSPNTVVAYPVHTKVGANFDSWGEKIDESRLIKEFSYQYIKSNKNDGKNLEDDKDKKSSKVLLTKRFEVPPQNIVQNRIKAFEITKEDECANLAQVRENKFKMQEPLKVSPSVYQSNEAHVSALRTVELKRESPKKTEEEMSNLRRSRRTSLHGFALGDAISMLEEEAKYAKRENLTNGKTPKSVKDLLADFERKSIIAMEQLAAEEKSSEENSGKRDVFSDTETLLYDTSSDLENNHDGAVFSGLMRSEVVVSEDDEDRDEEVAAVLGQSDKFVSTCRDLSRNQDSKQEKKMAPKVNRSGYQHGIEKITEDYLQLSMIESTVTFEDLESHSSTSRLEKTKSEETKLKLSSSPEQHYMPMTPSKKPLTASISDVFIHTRTSSASLSFNTETQGEESSYVEMTNGNIRSLLAPDTNKEHVLSNADAQNYCEIRSDKDSAHYEFLYKANSNNTEPLYMEVSPLFEDDKKDGKNKLKDSPSNLKREDTEGAEQPPTPPRTALPDILNPSSNVQKQSSIKSDSSDADDEASKDLDSLDAPRHPRFSLSDTFRPASYYLGASIGERTLIGMTAEHPDSSDSDLVSPPPIPTSPPPLDDLETSLESSVDTKKLSPVQMKSDSCKIDIEESDNSIRIWNPTPRLGKDVKCLQERMESLNLTPIVDDALSSETDSIDSNKRDRMMKRRPVSADILNSLQDNDFRHCSTLNGRHSGGSDLDSIGSRNGLAMDLEEGEGIDFDQYLEGLQNSNKLSPKLSINSLNYDCYSLYDKQKFITQNQSSNASSIPEAVSYTPDGSSSNDKDYSNTVNQQPSVRKGEVHYENLQCLFPPPPSAEYLQELSSENGTVVRYSSPEGGHANTSSPARIVEGQGNEDINLQAGAPYYYSDLLKAEQEHQMSNRLANISRSFKMQQLNNQREDNNLPEINFLNKRNDIGRRVNAINQILPDQVIDKDDAAKLAEELRTTSVHFLGTADKIGLVDKRNLYEADTLQRRKASTMMAQRYRSQTPDLRSSARNLYPQGIRDKNEHVNGQERQPRRRSRSLEGLLDEPEFSESEPRQNRVSPGSAISRLLQTTQPQSQNRQSPVSPNPVANALRSSRSRAPPPPPDVWEEDSLWRESLRRVSIRHTRSLDDLDRDSSGDLPSAENRGKVNREVTYVNNSVTVRSRTNHREYEEDYREGRSIRPVRTSAAPELDDGVLYERLVPRDSEVFNRTRRGQTYIEGYVWDEEREVFHRGEKSNLPVRDPPRKPSQPFLEVGLYPTRPPSFEIDREKLRQWDLMSSAPAGMLGAGGGSCPVGLRRGSESAPPGNLIDSTPPSSPASGSGSVIGRDPLPPRQVGPPPVVDKPPPPSLSPASIPAAAPANEFMHHKRPERSWSLQLSAGELLGRTHEELVLLLIQLRRQSAGFCKAMEACHMEIEAQARLVELETPKRMEHLQKLEDLKRHLLELEKQYEKGKPLVNLVDNMVKLGSLYRVGAPLPGSAATPLLRDRLEFNHQVQERRLLAEERRDWERLSPDHTQLQAKVEQLYRLDRLLQQESGTLQSLQQDKEMLERALGGLRHKLQAVSGNAVVAEKYRRQQRLLERELSKVRSILAHNSKKLEETVAENARLEQELVVLRQKLVWSRRAPDQSVSSTTQLEQELTRVQSLVGDLQRQRLELSSQVRQLTERSNSLSQQIRPSPTGVQGVGAVGSKKTLSSSWLETDLDTQVTQDLGRDSPLRSPLPHPPLYVNTDVSKSLVADVCSTYEGSVSQDEQQELTSAPLHPPPSNLGPAPTQYTRPMDINEADDRMKKYYGIIPRDKPQEIKTVRIVKRESERRQRDRDRSGNIGIPLTNTTSAKRVTIIEENVPAELDNKCLGRVMEEIPEPPSEVLGGSLNPRVPPAPGPRSDSVQALRNLVNRQRARVDSDSTSPSHSVSAHEQLFGSSDTLLSPQLSPVYQSQAARQIVEEMAYNNRRAVPREKRRHHTVSGRPLLRIDTSYSAGGSRDDLDMERALRPRLNTPDVVRSTLSRTETKYTTETIDSILGTPGKILIPERYIPESTPELTSEEQQKRNKKAESIRKMLSETTQISGPDDTTNELIQEEEKSSTLKKKVAEEKRQREHLLQLNQILAQQVMEKSKMVAGSNAASSQD